MATKEGIAIVVTALLLCFLLHSNIANATTFTVGDSQGWGFAASSWPNGKSFKAGDILVFNYNPSMHNVVVVSKAAYDSCNIPAGAKTYSSGKDQIKLAKGQNYFTCSFPGHCSSGMKIVVFAA
ncbi:unnamed protein product [Ilex paraguariensis]|uniref:Basic blue protein n=1 Tax=Ilex paraguariensis TaxID=185542 RepID=A0ABC8UCV8_9AQUA